MILLFLRFLMITITVIIPKKPDKTKNKKLNLKSIN